MSAMYHQSGIIVSTSLREKFAEMKDGHIRVVVVTIDTEQLVWTHEHNAEKTLNHDFAHMIPPLVKKNRAAYYFIRLDTISEINGHNWLLITYIPDEAQTREKMLYAATLSTVKREFGLAYIVKEIRASSKDEITLHFCQQDLNEKTSISSIINSEDQSNIHIGINDHHKNLQCLKFPFDENVIEALHLFKKHHADYIQLEIDYEKELILLSHSEAHATPEHVRKYLPDNQGRYHLYRFRYDFNHKKIDANIFLHSVPSHPSRIKECMLYASCKENVIDDIEKKFGIILDKKLEICDTTDFTIDFLFEHLHPEMPTTTTTNLFTKSDVPSHGLRRSIKTNNNSDD